MGALGAEYSREDAAVGRDGWGVLGAECSWEDMLRALGVERSRVRIAMEGEYWWEGRGRAPDGDG